MRIDFEVRVRTDRSLPYALYETTGRVRLCLGWIRTPFAKKRSRLGRLYLWAGGTRKKWWGER